MESCVCWRAGCAEELLMALAMESCVCCRAGCAWELLRVGCDRVTESWVWWGAAESWVWWRGTESWVWWRATEIWVWWRAECDGELLTAGCDGELDIMVSYWELGVMQATEVYSRMTFFSFPPLWCRFFILDRRKTPLCPAAYILPPMGLSVFYLYLCQQRFRQGFVNVNHFTKW